MLVLLYAGVAALLSLPQLRAATALALSIGLGGALVTQLQSRHLLAVVWAELTAWIGVAFWITSCWNAVFGAARVLVAIDLGIALVLLLLGFHIVRAARHQST